MHVEKEDESDSIVDLNVGGSLYSTTRSTLCRYPDSKLAMLFSGQQELRRRPDGRVFIDRDGEMFKYVLHYLRDGDLHVESLDRTVREQLKLEAIYFGLSELERKLQTLPPEDIYLQVSWNTRTEKYEVRGNHPRSVTFPEPAAEAGKEEEENTISSVIARVTQAYSRVGYKLTNCYHFTQHDVLLLFNKK